jgi:hypothetical protein
VDDELGARLAEWAADARADEAVAERRRHRWLSQLAAEEATLRDVLRGSVVVRVRGGGGRSGVVTAVGSDFVVVDHAALIPLAAVVAVRPLESGAVGARLELSFEHALARLVEDRPRLRIEVDGGEPVVGDLGTVGTDVVQVDGVYVPLAAISAVTLL